MKITPGILLLCFFLSGCTKDPQTKGPNSNPDPTSFTREQSALISAVKETGALSVNGQVFPFICNLSEKHVDYMISQQNISHDGYSERAREIQNHGGTNSGEIVAYNCGHGSLELSARQCATSWVNSPGHWKLMKQYWDGFCYAMKEDQNGCYYCVGLFGSGSLQ